MSGRSIMPSSRLEPVDFGVIARPVGPEPEWKKGRPRSRALIASQAEVNLVLDSIGPDPCYMEQVENLDVWFEHEVLQPGIWIVDFHIKTWKSQTWDGTEYDEELVIDSIRHASKEEVEAHRNGDFPWDPEEWMSNWPEIRDWRWPGRPDREVIEEICAMRSIGYHTHRDEGQVELRFGVPNTAQAVLVFDAADKLVKVEQWSPETEGVYEIEWNYPNTTGDRSGTYTWRGRAQNADDAIRMWMAATFTRGAHPSNQPEVIRIVYTERGGGR